MSFWFSRRKATFGGSFINLFKTIWKVPYNEKIWFDLIKNKTKQKALTKKTLKKKFFLIKNHKKIFNK